MARSTSFWVDVTLEARMKQAAGHDQRSFNNMAVRLLELGLKEFWKNGEPKIENSEEFLRQLNEEKQA